MAVWIPMFVLANIDVTKPIEVEGISLTSAKDERIQKLSSDYPKFQRFLSSFSNEFGKPTHPSVIICQDDAPPSYRSINAIAAFRDVISMSIIPQSWAQNFRFGNNMGIKFSDYFAAYPWMVDKNYDRLITSTLDMFGLHDVGYFQGKTTPALSENLFASSRIDDPILNKLLPIWERAFGGSSAQPNDLRLFRSLNMANAAAMLPAGAEAIIFDIGRSVSLWASALEILAPAKSQAYLALYELLERNSWQTAACSEAKYEVYGLKGTAPKTGKTTKNLPCWLLGEIFHARNDYLHGNPVEKDRLVVEPAKRPLHNYSSLLYRMAIAVFIGLESQPRPPRPGETPYETFLINHYSFQRFQDDIEVALSSIMYTEEEFQKSPARRG